MEKLNNIAFILFLYFVNCISSCVLKIQEDCASEEFYKKYLSPNIAPNSFRTFEIKSGVSEFNRTETYKMKINQAQFKLAKIQNKLNSLNKELSKLSIIAENTENAIAIYNNKYNICAVLLLNDAQKIYPNLFSLGMGEYSKPFPMLLKSLNWKLQKVPFFFKVFNPNSFLKNIRYLQNTKLKSFFIMLMIYSGLGWLFIKFIFQVSTLFNFRLKKNTILLLRRWRYLIKI